MAEGASTCIAVRGLVHEYRPDAASAAFRLELARFDLERGRPCAWIGPSGSGKTTLAMLLAGILLPQAGSIDFEGRDLTREAEPARRALRLRRFGLVFQELELVSWLDALENVLFPFRVRRDLGVDASKRQRARELCERLDLGPVLGRKPERLSQGERQRVAIARALVHEPDVLFLDEATGNLDEARAGLVLDLVLEEVQRRDAALFYITHDRSVLGRFAALLDLGVVLDRAERLP